MSSNEYLSCFVSLIELLRSPSLLLMILFAKRIFKTLGNHVLLLLMQGKYLCSPCISIFVLNFQEKSFRCFIAWGHISIGTLYFCRRYNCFLFLYCISLAIVYFTVHLELHVGFVVHYGTDDVFIFKWQVCRVLRRYYQSAQELHDISSGGLAEFNDGERDPRLQLKEAKLRIEEALGTCVLPSLQLIPANPAVGQGIWELMSLLPYEVIALFCSLSFSLSLAIFFSPLCVNAYAWPPHTVH